MNQPRSATPRLLAVALAAVLGSAVVAVNAQTAATTTTTTDATIVESSTVPKSRLVERYTELAGSEAAAAGLIEDLRAGEDFTVTETVTRTVTNADGTTRPETTTVERTIDNAAGPMGWGEVNITLSLAQALVDAGKYPDLQSALSGTTTTVTNPDGSTTTTTTGGVLAMRADGMGWGAIAKELGYNLGSLMSAGKRSERATTAQDRTKAARATGAERAAAAKPAKPERVATSRPEKPERVARVDRPERPERVERPARPERVERPERPVRPERPERGGRGG